MYGVAVTGTNGKTTTVAYARQLVSRRPARAVSISSLGMADDRRAAVRAPFLLSEPGCWAGFIEELSLDYDAAVLEAFSGGLAAGEWAGAELDAAVLTTFGRDHLDIHKSRAAYARAKLRLFSEALASTGTGVLATSCVLHGAAARACRSRGCAVVSYGPGGDVALRRARMSDDGVEADLDVFGRRYHTSISVSARFLAENALAALAVAVVGGADVDLCVEGLSSLVTPPGRLQRTQTARRAEVFVDDAHNPDALEAVLAFALDRRARAGHGAVILLFGCGGGRDREKRAPMAAVADRLADHVVLTDDNPRNEDAEAIRATLRAACPRAEVIGDRAAAIHHVVQRASSGDIVLVCGRGADPHQECSGSRRPASDLDMVRRASREISSEGMPMNIRHPTSIDATITPDEPWTAPDYPCNVPL